jgi:hypothetical protein
VQFATPPMFSGSASKELEEERERAFFSEPLSDTNSQFQLLPADHPSATKIPASITINDEVGLITPVPIAPSEPITIRRSADEAMERLLCEVVTAAASSSVSAPVDQPENAQAPPNQNAIQPASPKMAHSVSLEAVEANLASSATLLDPASPSPKNPVVKIETEKSVSITGNPLRPKRPAGRPAGSVRPPNRGPLPARPSSTDASPAPLLSGASSGATAQSARVSKTPLITRKKSVVPLPTPAPDSKAAPAALVALHSLPPGSELRKEGSDRGLKSIPLAERSSIAASGTLSA